MAMIWGTLSRRRSLMRNPVVGRFEKPSPFAGGRPGFERLLMPCRWDPFRMPDHPAGVRSAASQGPVSRELREYWAWAGRQFSETKRPTGAFPANTAFLNEACLASPAWHRSEPHNLQTRSNVIWCTI